MFLTPAYPSTGLTDDRRNIFCGFSGEGVNSLRNYLNDVAVGIYDTESATYDDDDDDNVETEDVSGDGA